MRGGKLNDPNFKSRIVAREFSPSRWRSCFRSHAKRRESISAGRSSRQSIFSGLQERNSISFWPLRIPDTQATVAGSFRYSPMDNLLLANVCCDLLSIAGFGGRNTLLVVFGT